MNNAGAQTYGDFTFASTNGFGLLDGVNYFTVIAKNLYTLWATNNLVVSLPTNVLLRWDSNGNLTNNGTLSLSFDAENRLTNITFDSTWKTEFVYDGLGRRRIERDYGWQSGGWNRTNELHFVYDGWLLVQVRDGSNNVLVTYTRGLDMSGSLAGAGGIGGLLARTDGGGNSLFYHADGGGNITALIDAWQVVPARYMYSPFGSLIRKSGPMADANQVQFSSMFTHGPSGIILSPTRGYDPRLQQWLTQDPIGEAGGMNLYGYVGNSPLNFVDPFGLLTAVFVGGPSPADAQNSSGNPFGHSAIAFSGQGIYSFGTPEQPGSSFTDFLNNQAKYRDGTVYVLDTTPEQEKAMIDYLKKVMQERPHLGRYPDNCANRTTGALKAGGAAPPDLTRMPHSDSFDLGENVNGNWPSLIGDALNNAGALQISVPKGTTLPANFLTGFNPKP